MTGDLTNIKKLNADNCVGLKIASDSSSIFILSSVFYNSKY